MATVGSLWSENGDTLEQILPPKTLRCRLTPAQAGALSKYFAY